MNKGVCKQIIYVQTADLKYRVQVSRRSRVSPDPLAHDDQAMISYDLLQAFTERLK